jgi:HEAT repeat protein
MLTHDPDPDTGKALADQAVNDKSDLVRTAALEAVSQRGDPALLDGVVSAMFDQKDSVKYTAAATVVHLDHIAKRRRRKPGKP